MDQVRPRVIVSPGCCSEQELPTAEMMPLRSGVVDALNAEWQRLGESDAVRETLNRWATTERGLAAALDPAAGGGGLTAVAAAVRAEPDGVLGGLIRLDHEGEPLAARVVIQLMLGKLIRMASRDPAAEVDDYVAQLWLLIRSYPLRRRPTRIAANLALDTLKAVRSEYATIIRARRHPVVVSSLDATEVERPAPAKELSAGQVVHAAHELGLIDEVTRRVLNCVYTEGWSGKEAAKRLAMSHSMVRFRCSRGLKAMAPAAVQLATAA